MTTVVDNERKQVLDRLTSYVREHANDIPAESRRTAGGLQKWMVTRRTSHPTDYNSVRAAWRRLEAMLTGTISAAPAVAATPVPASTFAPVSVALAQEQAQAPAAVDIAPAMPAPTAPAPAPAPAYSTKPYEGQARQRASYGK